MKALLINGSPHEKGCTYTALRELADTLEAEGIETVVLLSRETNPLTVEVRMEVETGEVKEHPTYKRIQEYVQEKYGFKVHRASCGACGREFL